MKISALDATAASGVFPVRSIGSELGSAPPFNNYTHDGDNGFS